LASVRKVKGRRRQPHHNWPTLLEVLDRCEECGGVKKQLSGEIVTDEGAYKIYYLVNTIEDNERVPPSVRESIERRLGITLGFPF
jgi:hypothetical protein